MSKSIIIWIALLTAFLSTGCSSTIKAEQPVVLDTVLLDESRSLGQSFDARFDGLDGIEVFLQPFEGGGGVIQLILRDKPQGAELGQANLSLSKLSTSGFYSFPLPIQADSNQQIYYLDLTLRGNGQVLVGAASGDSYLNGALYRNNQPDDDHQLAFKLSYSTPKLVRGLIGEILTWGWNLLLAGFLFIPPGWAIMNSVFPNELHRTIKLTVSIGTSLALYPTILLLTNTVGLQLGPLYAWLPPIFGLLTIIWQKRHLLSLETLSIPNIKLRWVDLSFIGVTLVIFVARFWIIRGVEIPLWGDSLQHSMISQLILEHGGLFTSWRPYAPYYSFTTHFGFSTFAALFAWITNTDGIQATLWMGQIINGLAILTLYPLAVKISRGNHWVGIGSMLTAGLLFSLPANYVNWGRYVQLAGQAVLPISLWLLWDVIDRDQWSLRAEWPRLLLASSVLTGMMLSYYRMPFFYAIFALNLLLFWGLPRWGFKLNLWYAVFTRLIIIAVVGILFTLPWGVRLLGSNLAEAVEAGVTVSSSSARVSGELQILLRSAEYISPIYFWLAGLSLIIALVRKNWLVAALPLWFVLLVAYMSGSTIGLPGANMLQGFAIMIAIYIPLGLIIGWSYGQIMVVIERGFQEWALAAASILTIMIAIWFGWHQRLLLDMQHYALVNPPDQRAMSWIERHTPPEAIFLVQGFEYRNTAAGSDAGWWIPLLGQRDNMLPPQYTQFNEVSKPPDYTRQVVELVTLLEDKPLPNPESVAALCDWGITHIYHGQGQGEVGNNVTQLYNPEDLKAEPDLFTPIYHQDRVYIFELNPVACQANS